MSNRKNRLSLSKDLHKDKDAKTPMARRTSARSAKGKASPDVQRHDDSYEVSPSQGSDYSPLISLTQDTSFHAINGVSWEWNSPQRLREQQRLKIAAAPGNGHHHHQNKLPLRPKYSDIPDTAPVKKATGFNKFISKLNLLMEKENVVEEQLNAPITDPVPDPEESYFGEEFFVDSDTKQSIATTKSEDSDDDIFQEHAIGTPVKKSASNTTAAELDDSKLDNLLIEASQTIEEKLNQPTSPPPRPAASSPPQQKIQPFAPRSKVNVPLAALPIEMNDSDMDGFLVQASLMVEEKLSDSSQESSSNSNVRPTTVSRTETVTSSHHSQLPGPIADKRDTKCSTSSSSEGTRETTMSQEELKALIEKKRQEALRRLQNNRLKRVMKGANTHG
ncbi:uncharacterized protein LOC126559844 [Anopheles maculipalpis]|uniref:uncharacterized protein LOC126559844 n=1 Tax=Anopheles maculipalpis TaxID=1496333 RepID=UPI002159B28A|nr:uncharacterized protein LOC126559844 [Anopheles maculipalpis]